MTARGRVAAGWLGPVSVLLAFMALAVLVDALASYRIEQTLEFGERREVVPGLLVLTHVHNTGAAFGLLAGQRWLLVLVAAGSLAAAPLLLRVIAATRAPWAGPVVVGLLMGGALGNALERVRTGYVTDFLNVPIMPLFQNFNLSDVSISLAVVALIWLSMTDKAQPAARSTQSRASHEGGTP